MGPAQLASILDVFLAAYERCVPFREDRALGVELRAEAQPVLETLLDALERSVPLSQAHEASALLTLLARRAGLSGATPTAAHALVRALVEALSAAGQCVVPELEERLHIVCFEGFVAGRDERHQTAHEASLRASQVQCTLAPRCVCAFFSGRHDVESLSALLDDFGRLALNQDALVCLADVGRLPLDDEHTARALFHGLATLGALGAAVVLCGPRERLTPWVERFGRAVRELDVQPDFDAAYRAMLTRAGFELKARRRWPTPRELFTRGRSSGSDN